MSKPIENYEIIRSILNTFHDIALIIDNTGIILAHNEHALQLLSKFRNDLVGLNLKNFMNEAMIQILNENIKPVISKRQPLHVEERIFNKLFDIYFYPIREENTKPDKIILFARDITEKRRIEESEIRKTLEMEKLLETARDLTSSLDILEVLSRIGKRASEILQSYSSIYLLEKDNKTLTPQVVVDPVYEEEILSIALDVDNSLTGKSVRLKKSLMFNNVKDENDAFQIPETSELDNERVIVVPFVSNNIVLGAMCLNRIGTMFTKDDLSLAETFAAYATIAIKNAQTYQDLQHEYEERKKAESQLAAHQEHLRMINKILRHDLLNNLGVLKSSVNLYLNSEKEERYIREAQKGIDKSIDLINRMRKLENLLNQDQNLKMYDINKLISRISANYSDLKFSIKGSGKALADEALVSVIDNIFNNAIIHGKADKIDIVITTDKMCMVRIADNGKGIPEEILSHIFEENFHYGESGNTGLGLHIAKKTLERYRGYIYAEAVQPQGTAIILAMNKITD